MANKKLQKSRSRKKTATKRVSSTKGSTISRSIELPGVIAHTVATWRKLNENKRLFLRFIAVMLVVFLFIAGTSQQAQYMMNRDAVAEYASSVGGGAALEITLLLSSIISGAQNSGLGEAQQLVVMLLYIFFWLTALWLLRYRIANEEVTVRDALYAAPGPFVGTFLVGLLGLVQLLPLTVGLVVYANIAQFVNTTIWAGIVAVAFIGLAVLTLYWLITTLFAAMVVTIPGTYPVAALRTARKLVSGIRSKIVVRLLWLGLISIIATIAASAVGVGIDKVLGGSISFVVLVIIQFVTLSVCLYVITYIYLLYRSVIDARS